MDVVEDMFFLYNRYIENNMFSAIARKGQRRHRNRMNVNVLYTHISSKDRTEGE